MMMMMFNGPSPRRRSFFVASWSHIIIPVRSFLIFISFQFTHDLVVISHLLDRSTVMKALLLLQRHDARDGVG